MPFLSELFTFFVKPVDLLLGRFLFTFKEIGNTKVVLVTMNLLNFKNQASVLTENSGYLVKKYLFVNVRYKFISFVSFPWYQAVAKGNISCILSRNFCEKRLWIVVLLALFCFVQWLQIHFVATSFTLFVLPQH
jgi:hypothetical protein